MKTTTLLFIAMLFFGMPAEAQVWDWTHPEPNGNLDPNSEHDDPHDIEVDAAGNVYVLGDYSDSLFLNNIYRATDTGSYLAKYDSTGALLWYDLIKPATPGQGFIIATDLTVTAQGVFITGIHTPSNSYYDCTTGQTSGTVYSYNIGSFSFNSTYNDAGYFVAKLSSNGNVFWNKILTGQYCFVDINGNHYRAGVGAVASNPLVTKDKNNNIICQFSYSTSWNKRTSLAIGTDSIPITTSTHSQAIYVFKMNNAGNLLWSNYAVDPVDAHFGAGNCNSLIADNNGNVFLYGSAYDNCAFGSTIYHTNHYIKTGETSSSTFIAKLSSSGTWLFAKELCNSSRNILSGGAYGSPGNPDLMAVDAQNNLYTLVNGYSPFAVIAGDTLPTGATNTYLARFNNAGTLSWHKGFGSSDTHSNSIHFANNALYISGGIRNYTYGGKPWYFSTLNVLPSSPNFGASYEYYVSKANTNGDFQWATTFSGLSSVHDGFAVKAFNDHIYTCGYYRGSISTLGNLNGIYTSPNQSTQNLFFGKIKDQHIRVGAVTPLKLTVGCSILVPFTSYGLVLSGNNIFTAELSDINGDFSTTTPVGSVTSTGSGIINGIIPSGFGKGAGYRLRIRSSDTLKTGYKYYAYADTGYVITIIACAKTTNLTTSNITATSAKLNWSAVTCAKGYQYEWRKKGTTTWTTALATVVSKTVTGLTPSTTYQWRVITACKISPDTITSGYVTGPEFTTAAVAFAATNNSDEIKITGALRAKLYPNPATNIASVSFSNANGKVQVMLSDLSGKQIWQSSKTLSNDISIPIQHLASGTYILKVRDEKESIVIMMVKEK